MISALKFFYTVTIRWLMVVELTVNSVVEQTVDGYCEMHQTVTSSSLRVVSNYPSQITRSSSLVGHTKAVRPETHILHGINYCYILDVFIWKRKTVRRINTITANYKCKIPRPNDQHSFQYTILAIVNLLTLTVQ